MFHKQTLHAVKNPSKNISQRLEIRITMLMLVLVIAAYYY